VAGALFDVLDVAEGLGCDHGGWVGVMTATAGGGRKNENGFSQRIARMDVGLK
jgi:hypothetical protein